MPKLTDLEYDTLKEIATIGAGNASGALSQMIDQKVKVEVPDLKVLSVEEVPEIMGKAEQVMTVVLLKIIGDAPGTMLLLLNPNDAARLASLLTKRKKRQAAVLDEIDRSALREVGNILAGSSLNALSGFLKMNLLQSIPDTATDMLRAVINSIVAELGEKTEDVLVLETSLTATESGVSGKLYFLFDPASTEKILAATRSKIGLQQ